MHSIFSYVLAAGAGVLIAHFVSRAPELRFMRLSQLIFVPAAMAVCLYFLPEAGGSATGGLAGFICFVAMLGFLALLLAPNIAHLCGAGLSNLLDPQDWTPTEEEIALRPVRSLIDKDQFHPALTDLDELLKNRKPTYEALLLKVKLLNHLGGWDEAVATLLRLIELSHTTEQQLAVMEYLTLLEQHQPEASGPRVAGSRRIQIRHELVLFQTNGAEATSTTIYKAIPPGTYKVEEILHRNRCWLKLAGEDWGNAEMCWEVVGALDHPVASPPKSKQGFLWQIAGLHGAVTTALKIKRKSRRHDQAAAQKLFHEANELIRRQDWPQALPLLQQASACDPDRYEIAYRWVQAVRQTASDAATAQVVSQVLNQSLWTQSEQYMLQELKKPLAD